MLLILENFDNSDTMRKFSTQPTLQSGSGKNNSIAALSMVAGNHLNFKKSKRVVLGFYARSYTTGYVYFGYGDTISSGESFRIIFTITPSTGKVVISFYNPQQGSIENYPVIANQTAYQDIVNGYSLIEIYLDLEDASAHMGVIKIAIDGKEYVNLSNTVNAPINLWTDGLNSNSARYSWVAFSGFTYIDSLYLCNEGKGYNDDFFGPFDIATLAPIADGENNNWERREYSEQVEEDDPRGNYYFVSKVPVDLDNAEYLNLIASQTLVKDLFLFAASTIPGTGDILAIAHHVWFKALYAKNPDAITLLTPIGKASGQAISYESDYEVFSEAWYYKQITMPYDVVPTLAIPWTREQLALTQFGFCFYETEISNLISLATLTGTNRTSLQLEAIRDGSETTNIGGESSFSVFFSPGQYVYGINILVSSTWIYNSIIVYDTDGMQYNVAVPYYTDNTSKHWDLLPLNLPSATKKVERIVFNISTSHYVYELQILTWSKVGA